MKRGQPRRGKAHRGKPQRGTAQRGKAQRSEAPTPAPPLSVIILAAGQGKRMRSDQPKVLQPLAGRPLLTHVIETARALAPAAIHVVYGHGADQLRARLEHEPLSWVLQAEQRGTGHAVQQAAPHVPDAHRVLILYGDVPLLRTTTLQALLDTAGAHGLGLLTALLADPSGYGRIVRDRQGRVRRIVEQRDASPRELAIREGNIGVLALPAGALKRWLAGLRDDNAQGEFYLTDVIARAVKSGFTVRALVAPDPDEVLGVNDRVQLAQVEAAYRRRRADELMQAGATLIDPLRIDVRGSVRVGRDVVIDVNVVLEGEIVLGDRVYVGPHCVLRNAEVGADTEILPQCVMEQVRIGTGCRIGPFTRIRPKTTIAAGVHLGNFVEVKNSEVGVGSKANHLSYLGDTTVGAGVNVGAGTITCNYDGANKWRTRIEDGASIGAGTMLVAPLTVGAHSTIGAGSTLTQDAPAGELTLARARQLTITGWQRPKKQRREE